METMQVDWYRNFPFYCTMYIEHSDICDTDVYRMNLITRMCIEWT